MQLFVENELPFLLSSPGDIAKFFERVVPALKEREWEISSNVEEFSVSEDPVDISFTLSSADQGSKNWFHFEPNTEIGGQQMSCQEIARLMIQNQGYVKTKKGFVKISEKSQHELKLLVKFKAFGVGQKFNAAEILPLIATTSVLGGNHQTKDFISRFKSNHELKSCTPSAAFKGQLRDYQQSGINWLHFLYSAGLGGVLADDMGLGKTVMALAFSSQLTDQAPTLIIGPTNVIFNWESEIKKFLPSHTAVVYTGSNRLNKLESLLKADFIISSFGIIKNDLDYIKGIPFKSIFVDEAQYMKNPNSQISKAIKQLQSRFKIVMTGTPVENHLQDLWNLFDFVMPDYLGNKRKFDIDVKDGQLDILKTKIKPFILRRLKSDVLDSLPEKTEIIMHCKMSETQEQLYKTVLEAVKIGLKSVSGKRERLHVLTSLLKLRQVCVHPGLLAEFKDKNLESAKYDLVRERILELVDEGHKITLFSQFTGMLDILEDWAKEVGIYFERIDGSVSGKKRKEAIDRFQDSDKAGLFLISLKAGGVGIN